MDTKLQTWAGWVLSQLFLLVLGSFAGLIAGSYVSLISYEAGIYSFLGVICFTIVAGNCVIIIDK